MKLVVVVIILISMEGVQMRPETEHDGIKVQLIQQYVEDNYCDYDTATTTESKSILYNESTLLGQQPSTMKSIEETIYKDRKIQDEDGGKRFARSPTLINWPTRLPSRRKKSLP